MVLKNSQIRSILESYDVGNLKSKKLVHRGWNVLYRVKTTRGDFILKILNFQSEKELQNELNVLSKLKDRIPLSFPVLNKNDKPWIKYDNKIVLIKKFIKGKPILEGGKLSKKNLLEFGKYYATIHQTKDTSNIPKRDLYFHLQKFFSKIDNSSKEYKVAQEIFNLLNKRKFNPGELPRGLIHGDLHTANILVDKGRIVAILDFEDSHIGSFIYDLGFGILDTCWEKNRLSQEKIKTFLSGYEQIRKLTLKEKEHLLDSAILAGLYSLHFYIIQNGINNKKNLNSYFIERSLRLLKESQQSVQATSFLNA